MRFSTLQIAWRNLGRSRWRTSLAVGAIALGQFTVVFVNGLLGGSFNEMLRAVTGPLVGHVQIHRKGWSEEHAGDLFLDGLSELRKEIAALPEVETVSPRVYSAVLAAPGEKTDEPADAEMAMIVGVDVGVDSGPGGLIESLPADQLPGGHGVVLGKILARRLGVGAGQQIAVIGQDVDGFPVSDLFLVRGIVASNVDLVRRMGIVMSLADAGELLAMPDQAHEIVVRGKDQRKAEALARQIRALPGLADAEVLPWREAVPELVPLLDMKGWLDMFFIAIVFLAAAAGITNTAMMSTFERTHEFGMLLALGTRPRRLVWMVLLESLLIGLIGVAIGTALGTAVVLITARTGIDFAALGGVEAQNVAFGGVSFSYIIRPVLEWRHAIFGLVAVTLTSVLASAWPASLAARLQPAEALRS